VALSALARNALFEGLTPAELDELAGRMRSRRFERNEAICRAGDPGDSLFVIADGLAHVLGAHGAGGSLALARLRPGDVIGEMSLLTGELRSATVVAATPTTALELGQRDFAAVVARQPRILANLSRILSHRLAETTARIAQPRARGEAVGLLVGSAAEGVVPELIAATAAATPRPVTSVDARLSSEEALGSLDDLLGGHATVLVVGTLGLDTPPLLVDSVDRVVALVAHEGELQELEASLERAAGREHDVEVVVVASSEDDCRRTCERAAAANRSVVRSISSGVPLTEQDRSWLGRHLARTKLGLALGAGGAKGYAHVGALSVLEQAGYTVDCVAGSSIGAVVGAWHALGMSAAEIESTMRAGFSPDVVAAMFELSMSGASTGVDKVTRLLRESTGDKSFADLLAPLVVMTVDLNARRPEPVTEGSLWDALVGAIAVAGLFPPHEREGQRLIDGHALVPVPTDALVDVGADVTVSVNLISRDTLPAWPGQAPPVEEPPTRRVRILDALLELMDVAQLDSSERQAARADVVVTPLFGPGSWRDFHLGDLFLDAGRSAAEEALPSLRALANPARP
jgi:predicted acylesterase/phospholipase RssA/CRP-like cAMP-binding protein